jgi:hypothetical protein
LKSHARNEQPSVEFQLMVENKLNIIMNYLMGIKHYLHFVKCAKCQYEENNAGVGCISSSSSRNNVYIISQDEEMGDP